MFPALKQNLDSHKFKDDCKMEMAMADNSIQELISTWNRKAPPML